MSLKKTLFSSLGSFAIALMVGAAPAHATTLNFSTGAGASQFNWQRATGDINFAWGSLPNERIPAYLHTIKHSINSTVSPSLCGIGMTNYDAIALYAKDFTGDGAADYVLDESAYFKQGESENCPVRICSAVNLAISGEARVACQIALYVKKSGSRITSSKVNSETDSEANSEDLGPCPKDASDNTTCRSECPASPDLCPTFFKYNFGNPALERYAFRWEFITATEYARLTAGVTNIYGSRLYKDPLNHNPVFVIDTNKDACTNEELLLWTDGALSGIDSFRCMKFLQYSGSKFYDLYDPSPYTGSADNSSMMTRVEFSNAASDGFLKDVPDGSGVCTAETCPWRGSSNKNGVMSLIGKDDKTFKLNGSAVPSQYRGYVAFQFLDSSGALFCRQYKNSSSVSYLVPAGTDRDLFNFISIVQANGLDGVSSPSSAANKGAYSCAHRFTDWVGATSCPSVPCNTAVTIAAERRCQRSSSAYGACSECAGIVDPHPVGGVAHLCTYKRICTGAVCPPHHSCLPAETKILMADGSEKAIVDVKVGDSVMGFSQKEAMGSLYASKVVSLMETEDSSLVRINDLKITGGHLLVTKQGKVIPANAVKVGDIIVGPDAELVEVKKAEPAEDGVTVYNFNLEDADGYVANGMRVMAFPVDR